MRKNKGAKKAKTRYHKGRPKMQMNQQSQQQQIDAYVRKVLGALENDPDSLSGTEKRFGAKYAGVVKGVRQIEGDLTQLREQGRQIEARTRSLELQHQSESGRAAAFLESLVSLKFEVDAPIQVPDPTIAEAPPADAKPAGGNGALKPPREAVPPAAQ